MMQEITFLFEHCKKLMGTYPTIRIEPTRFANKQGFAISIHVNGKDKFREGHIMLETALDLENAREIIKDTLEAMAEETCPSPDDGVPIIGRSHV